MKTVNTEGYSYGGWDDEVIEGHNYYIGELTDGSDDDETIVECIESGAIALGDATLWFDVIERVEDDPLRTYVKITDIIG